MIAGNDKLCLSAPFKAIIQLTAQKQAWMQEMPATEKARQFTLHFVLYSLRLCISSEDR